MLYTLASLALLVVWGVAIAFYQSPGWIHLLLTGAVALWVYGIVKPKAAGEK